MATKFSFYHLSRARFLPSRAAPFRGHLLALSASRRDSRVCQPDGRCSDRSEPVGFACPTLRLLECPLNRWARPQALATASLRLDDDDQDDDEADSSGGGSERNEMESRRRQQVAASERPLVARIV